MTRYLPRAPRELVAATKMAVVGLKDDQEIAVAIVYLKRFDEESERINQ